MSRQKMSLSAWLSSRSSCSFLSNGSFSRKFKNKSNEREIFDGREVKKKKKR